MSTGWPDLPILGLLIVGVLTVIALNRGLAPNFAGTAVFRWAEWIVAACWVAVNGVLVWLFAAPDMAIVILVVLFVLATTWVGWLAWMFYRPLKLSVRLSILLSLLILAAAFPLTVRVKGFLGAATIVFAWRLDRPAAVKLSSESPAASAQSPKLTQRTDHDYEQFLGPTRQGIIANARLSRDWNQNPPREIWRRPVGVGWSSFAVVGEYAVTQEQRESDECVVCYRLADGELAWIHADPVNFETSLGGPGPRATPTIADGRVYTVGATGILNCLDGVTGKPHWSVKILDDNGAENIAHGVCGSPLIVDNQVVVSPTGKNGICLAAYDRETGKRIWQGGEEQASYSSPMLAEVAGVRQILLYSSISVSGYEPQTGRRLWAFPWYNFENIVGSQPVVHAGGKDQILASVGYRKGSTLVRVERSGKGEWSWQTIWQSRYMKAKFTSPVLYRGFVYGLDDAILACLDLQTGKQSWKDGRYGHGQVLLAGDLLLVQAETGAVALVDPNPKEFRELGRLDALHSKTWNNPALAGSRLLVRNDQEAVCFELPVEKSETESQRALK
jgi:outer membrane protein assembly factor BamB